MPPLALRPSIPPGQPDIVPGYGNDSSSIYAGLRRPTVNGTPVSGYPATTPAGGMSNAGYLMAHGQRLFWPDGTPMTEDDMAGIRAQFEAAANEDRNRFDVGTDYNNRSLKSIDQQRQAQVQQAKDQLAEDRRYHSMTFGLDQQKFGEGQRQFNIGTGVDLLKTGASMRGPLNFVQGDMFAQGAQGISPWLSSLRTGQPVQFGGGTATQGNPTPLTVGTLANAMSGGGAPATGAVPGAMTAAGSGTDAYGRPNLSPGVQAAVDAGSQAFTSGLANKPLGWYEQQSDAQKQGLQSIGDYLGRSTGEDIQYYQRSRPGQRSALLG